MAAWRRSKVGCRANPALPHTALEVRSLADLRAFHRRLIARGVPVKIALNHGVSLSSYFDDPERYVIEVHWPTRVACRTRYGKTHGPDAIGRCVTSVEIG
jgi:catechol-2,3-dioxygenase